MNRAAIRRPGRSSEPLRSRSASIRQIRSCCLLTIVLMAISGCRSVEPAREPALERPVSQAAPIQRSQVPDEPIKDEPIKKDVPSEPESPTLEHSGETVWADGFKGELIAGVDGAPYEPYRRSAIERVQRALRNRNLYVGPINGILDAPTIKAIYEFQQAAYTLQRCGIPTPRTRRMLEQGSHTDPTS
jgi:hypothetical protein